MMENLPFYSLNQFYRQFFGHKVYKLSLDAGMTCPNRDGALDSRGCIFCSAGGSGDFAAATIDAAISRISSKYSGKDYIAYFQSYTNTYAPVEHLRRIFAGAVSDPRICGISVATRPDCLEQEKIELLAELSKIKPVWVELGLQTIREDTAQFIRRGYTLSVFEDALTRLQKAGLMTVVHMIVGLPGETIQDSVAAAKYLAKLPLHGIKIQLLHVLKETDLARLYEQGHFSVLTKEEYIHAVVSMIECLPPDMVIHRMTGDGPKSLLIAPLWSANKKDVLNSILREFKRLNTYQGKEYKPWL